MPSCNNFGIFYNCGRGRESRYTGNSNRQNSSAKKSIEDNGGIGTYGQNLYAFLSFNVSIILKIQDKV
jgi:hypothetical protein